MARRGTRDLELNLAERQEIEVAADLVEENGFSAVSDLMRRMAEIGYVPISPKEGKTIEDEYNGWTNYQTWSLFTYISQDPNWIGYWQSRALQIAPTPTTEIPIPAPAGVGEMDDVITSRARIELANMMEEEETESALENLWEEGSPFFDIFRHSLAQVDWIELAEAMWPEQP